MAWRHLWFAVAELDWRSRYRLDVTNKKAEDVGMPFPEYGAHGGGKYRAAAVCRDGDLWATSMATRQASQSG